VRVLVVDDEPLARRRLVRMLDRLGHEVVAQAGDGYEALQCVKSHQPDAVLLDIRMPGMDGLEVARRLGEGAPVIFTTAYDEHAIEAFDGLAIDFLLKPIQEERLKRALDRVQQRQQPSVDLASVLESLTKPKTETIPRVSARSGNALHLFDARDITRFFASNKYTVFISDGTEFLIEEGLSSLEQRLGDFGFFRVHRSELIRLDSVRSLVQSDGGLEAELSDGQRASVSRRMAPELRKQLGLQH
jgi:DNA-binding LytR/AlgR family response regulator